MNEVWSAGVEFFSGLPPLIRAVLWIVLGGAVAIASRFLVSRIFAVLKFDRISEKAGFSGFLKTGNVSYSPSKLMGLLAFWIVMMIALLRTVATLDAGIAASMAEWTASILPRLFAAAISGVIGVVIVTFLANFAETIARNAAMGNPAFLGRTIKYVGNVLVATMALDQLGWGSSILSTVFQVILAAAAFGAALAFGLGCKDMARRAAENFLRNLKERERSKHGNDLEG